MPAPADNRRSIYWTCVLALFTAALANSLRVGASGAMQAALLDPIDAQHSGEMIGTVLGSSFLGFALSLLVISPLLDRIGAKRVVLFASACFVVGPLLVLASSLAGSSVYLLLNVAQEQKLIEKHAKAAGVDAKVEWVKLSGGSAVNDALLSGNIEIASAGVGPLRRTIA